MFYLEEYDKLDDFIQNKAKQYRFEYRKNGYAHLYLVKDDYMIRIVEKSKIEIFYKEEHKLYDKGILLLDLKQKKEVIELFIKMVCIFIKISKYSSI